MKLATIIYKNNKAEVFFIPLKINRNFIHIYLKLLLGLNNQLFSLVEVIFNSLFMYGKYSYLDSGVIIQKHIIHPQINIGA